MGCVYKIENKINGRLYIGSTCDFKRRKHEHFGELKRHCHSSKKLQNDYDTYGADAFCMEPIEECSDELLRDREQYYIDLYDASNKGYNTSDNAYYSKAGFCTMDKDGENNPFYGKHHTEETRQKLRDRWEITRNARSGWKHKKSTIEKMRKKSCRSLNSNATIILQYDTDGHFIRKWECVADAVEYYGHSSHSNIINCCIRNAERTEKFCVAKGYIWRYAEAPKHKKVIENG